MQVRHDAALCLPTHLLGQVNAMFAWRRELSPLQNASLLGLKAALRQKTGTSSTGQVLFLR